MEFKNTILLSDLDGTLLNAERQVSEENIKAIQYFVDNGGRFGIATGRDIENVFRFFGNVPVNFFCIFSNGSALYHRESNKVLAQMTVNQERVIPFLERCLQEHPEIGIQLHTEQGTVFVPDHSNVKEDVWRGHEPVECKTLEELRDVAIRKVLFLTPEGDFTWLKAESAYLEDVVARVQSSNRYYELLPFGSSKGNMVNEIRKHISPDDTIYAVGDFYNDVEMVANADVGIYCANAPEELKPNAQHITVNHNESVMADVIHRIMKL